MVLRSAYRAFNARDLESAIGLMHPEVDWPLVVRMNVLEPMGPR
jgi:hypothetical protein